MSNAEIDVSCRACKLVAGTVMAHKLGLAMPITHCPAEHV